MFLALGFRDFQMIMVGNAGLRGVKEKPTDSFTDHTGFQDVRGRRDF